MAAEPARLPLRHASLAELVRGLRPGSGGYVLTAVRHGASDAATQRLLLALRGLGVPEAPRPALSPLDTLGLSLVRLEARNAGTPAPGLPSALLLSGDVPPQAMLLPAIQRVREARLRMRQQVGYTLFGGEGTAASTAHSEDHRRWCEIASMSRPL